MCELVGPIGVDNDGNIVAVDSDNGITEVETIDQDFNTTGAIDGAEVRFKLVKYSNNLVVFDCEGFSALPGTGNGGLINFNPSLPNAFKPSNNKHFMCSVYDPVNSSYNPCMARVATGLFPIISIGDIAHDDFPVGAGDYALLSFSGSYYTD